MLRVIVVDDELLAREGIRQLLAAHGSVTVVGEASTPEDAVDLIRRERPDVVFLDIEMRSATGFDMLQQLEDPPAIVFVTAHSKYAVQAYDVAAFDYLLKPVRPSRLATTLARLAKAYRSRAATDKMRRHGDAPVLRLKTGNRTLLLRTDSIVALRAEKDYTMVLAEKLQPILAGQSLGELEALVPSPPFARLDRSLVINLDRLREIETVDRSRTLVRLQGRTEEFLLGRTAAARLKRLQSTDGHQ